jgi:hypothetical protein
LVAADEPGSVLVLIRHRHEGPGGVVLADDLLEDELHRPQGDAVTVPQLPLTGEERAVDQGAVGAAQILHVEVPEPIRDAHVLARHTGILQHHVVLRGAADLDLGLLEEKLLPRLQTLGDGELEAQGPTPRRLRT